MNFLQRYKILLKTIGPVFIGSGDSILKRDWIFDRNNEIAIILDPLKLFSCLKEKGYLQDYEKSILDTRFDLLKWMIAHNFKMHEIYKLKAYTLDTSGIYNIRTMKNISLFIKDAYGFPYIPGSSIKGALRNVILAKKVKENPNGHPKAINDIRQRKIGKDDKNKIAKKIAQKYFHTLGRDNKFTGNMVNSILKGVRISDSKPISTDNLTLCQKVDVTVDNKEIEHQILRECIKPKTEICTTLTIDKIDTDIDIEYIKDAINEFLIDYNRLFLQNFPNEKQYSRDVLYLGGGVGYPSKTVTNQLLINEEKRVKYIAGIIDETLNWKQKKQHNHFSDELFGVSPHVVKLTEYDEDLFQFGPCEIKIVEI